MKFKHSKALATLAMGGSLLVLAACGGGGSSGGGSSVSYSGSGSSSSSSSSSSSCSTDMNGYSSCQSSSSSSGTSTSTSTYALTTVVASTPGVAANTDANLANGWGIAFNPKGYVWVSDNGTSKSTLYDGNGVLQQPVVSLPAGSAGPALPTGIVFNSTDGFQLTANGKTGTTPFIFAGLSGTIIAWSPSVDLNNGFTVYDGGASNAVYTGLAILTGSVNRLYATDFRNNHVDVFDVNFNKITVSGGFNDPNLPAGYSAFGIQAINGQVYVAYAKPDPATGRELKSAGLGLVDIFDADGKFVKRLIDVGGALNAPWGLAVAPADFGAFSNDLIVGNFGDGTINAFDPSTGAFMGTIKGADGKAIVVPGLWGIAFGNGINNQPTNTLFFAAGTSSTSGSYGRIDLK